ncbi:AsnC family protein [Phytobacter palmae]|uniref:AsnC family protein n=1 Tax=Phytobacter palmae TaxID=1855371 RepID=A0ABU9VC84_9ENTR
MKNFIFNQFGAPGRCPAHNRPWTTDEQNQLITLYPTTTCEELASLLNRGIPAIRFRIHKLRESGLLPTVKKKAFSQVEDDFIRRNASTMTAKEIATHLPGRSAQNVYRRAFLLGVSLAKCGNAHWSTTCPDEDAALIRALRDDGMRPSVIAEKFEVSRQMISWVYHRRLAAEDAVHIGRSNER